MQEHVKLETFFRYPFAERISIQAFPINKQASKSW